MFAQQGQQHASFFPQGQQPMTAPAWARALRTASGLFPATVGLAVVGLFAEAVLPSPHKPSDHIGGWLGKVHSAEIRAQQATVVENTRLIAEAQAAPPANYQMELAAFQLQQQAAYDAMQMKISMANAADLACVGGPLIGMFFDRGTTEARTANTIGAGGCELAYTLRTQIAAEQASLARNHSALMQRYAPGQTVPIAAPPATARGTATAPNRPATPIRY